MLRGQHGSSVQDWSHGRFGFRHLLLMHYIICWVLMSVVSMHTTVFASDVSYSSEHEGVFMILSGVYKTEIDLTYTQSN